MNTQTISATRKEREKKAWQAALTQKTVDIPSEWWGKTIQVIGYAYTPQQTWRGNTFQIAENITTIILAPKIKDVPSHWVDNSISIEVLTDYVPAGATCLISAIGDDRSSQSNSVTLSSGVATTSFKVSDACARLDFTIKVSHPSIPSANWLEEIVSIARPSK